MPATPQHTEKELFRQIAAGDRTAFRIIYERHWNRIFSVALSYLKSPEWAKDLVQEIFLTVWAKRENFREVENPGGYLFRIARNQLINALRQKFEDIPIEDRYRDSLPDNFLSPDGALALKQAEALIREAVEQLPAQQKLVFTLTRQEGLSHEAIAEQLGVNKRTVSNHATKALNYIRRYLDRHHQD